MEGRMEYVELLRYKNKCQKAKRKRRSELSTRAGN